MTDFIYAGQILVPILSQRTHGIWDKPRFLALFLTAVQVALLTIYDMCKAVDRGMTMTDVKLLEKHGGKSGSFVSN